MQGGKLYHIKDQRIHTSLKMNNRFLVIRSTEAVTSLDTDAKQHEGKRICTKGKPSRHETPHQQLKTVRKRDI